MVLSDWKKNDKNNCKTVKSQWIEPSTVASLIEETANQIESQQIKSNGFLVRGENQSNRGQTSQNRVENQQTQSTYDGGSGN